MGCVMCYGLMWQGNECEAVIKALVLCREKGKGSCVTGGNRKGVWWCMEESAPALNCFQAVIKCSYS